MGGKQNECAHTMSVHTHFKVFISARRCAYWARQGVVSLTGPVFVPGVAGKWLQAKAVE